MKNPTKIIEHLPTPSGLYRWKAKYLRMEGDPRDFGEGAEWYEISLSSNHKRMFYVPREHQNPVHRESIFFTHALLLLSKISPQEFPFTQDSLDRFYNQYSKHR